MVARGVRLSGRRHEREFSKRTRNGQERAMFDYAAPDCKGIRDQHFRIDAGIMKR
jgi:hypothetical protein